MRIAKCIIVVGCLLLATFAWAQREVRSSTARELTAMLNQFMHDASSNNAAEFDRFFADDLLYTGSNGIVHTKADIMRSLNAPKPAAAPMGKQIYSARTLWCTTSAVRRLSRFSWWLAQSTPTAKSKFQIIATRGRFCGATAAGKWWRGKRRKFQKRRRENSPAWTATIWSFVELQIPISQDLLLKRLKRFRLLNEGRVEFGGDGCKEQENHCHDREVQRQWMHALSAADHDATQGVD